ncbi:50S ribosomal protein L21 [candidate division WOR-3 bacterium]|nr:50S ribosomal protein L21 [candidate division WOR-3 bacterium]
MYAVVRIAGFQHVVREGEVITVPRLPDEPGSTVRLEEVLFLRTDKDLQVGRPLVSGAWVEASVVDHPRAPKVMTYKFIRRENYRRKKGHRQPLTRLKVAGIHAG